MRKQGNFLDIPPGRDRFEKERKHLGSTYSSVLEIETETLTHIWVMQIGAQEALKALRLR